MYKLLVVVAMVLMGGCVVEPTYEDIAAHDPIECRPCNGPGCEQIQEACENVESESVALICDDGAILSSRMFQTVYASWRIATCECPVGLCGW